MRVLYFAWMRERIGASEETIDSPAATVRDLLEHLRGLSEGHAAAFEDERRIRVAVDQTITDIDAPCAGATEVAFFPPMTGG